MKITRQKKLVLLWIVVGAAVAYELDDLSARFGVPARPQFATVTINRFYYINEKFNKFSLEPIGPVDQKCVNAVFPHSGSQPCWWLRRHTMQTIYVN